MDSGKKKHVAVIQSGYIPWKGYFDIIHDCDLFIFYDDVQYTTRDWRNRNLIKSPDGLHWLTIPVGSSTDRLTCDVDLPSDNSWKEKHWKALFLYYKNAPFFENYAGFFEAVYTKLEWKTLSELNQYIIREIATGFLGIEVEFRNSSDYEPEGQKLDRLLDLLKKANADLYVSGPAAKDYVEEERFREEGIELVYKSYDDYPEYPQLFPPFEHKVSIVDLLFNKGDKAPYYIWGYRSEKPDDDE